MMTRASDADLPVIVIVGGGFGGLAAAKALRHAPARVILIDRNNHTFFSRCCTRWLRLS
jgi:NADH dehydrogenase